MYISTGYEIKYMHILNNGYEIMNIKYWIYDTTCIKYWKQDTMYFKYYMCILNIGCETLSVY